MEMWLSVARSGAIEWCCVCFVDDLLGFDFIRHVSLLVWEVFQRKAACWSYGLGDLLLRSLHASDTELLRSDETSVQ